MPSAGHNVILEIGPPLQAKPNGSRSEVSHEDAFSPALVDDQGQDIAEYAVMLAVILVPVVGTIRLIGSNTNNVFSQVGSSLNN